ncbi:MAG: hypothetical protein BWK80_61300 [Desulfobacteraceae bacterium IS3]|nr:MAG: hypothetical protein BWK80_61300 [Desulfobacteraceae bacterium IS3]HAO20128.1 DUF4126 domain-containing protein [Desulfobacteraceae bacterium]
MENLNQIVHTIAMSMGLAWASGINLYAAMLVLGLLGASGNILLPSALLPLAHPLVITASGIMYFVEFFADKMPGVDTGWDTLHTFIRIPAGAILAASAVGDMDPALAVAAGIMGGTLSAGSHALKAGSRLIINTSPEPFSNWAASIGEDVAVVAGLWTALQYPFVFIIFLILFILLLIWALPKIWYMIKTLFQRIADLFRSKKGESA